VKTSVVIFPFDLFGGGGTAAGAQLVADAVREMLADNKREEIPTRARAYQGQVRVEEVGFDMLKDYSRWQDRAADIIKTIWRKQHFLLWVAGNHLGALPVYDELANDPAGTLVVQFDAHLDVYNLTDCTSELSHGNFLMHCKGPLPAIINLGHRELLLRPDHVKKYYTSTFSAAELAIDPEPALAYLRETCKKARRLFLDFDCDVFDPAFFPAVGHALPFGLTPPLILRLMDTAWTERIVGMSLSEFEPGRDVNDRSLSTLMWLIEYVLLRRYEK